MSDSLILVATDFSDVSHRAADYAVRLAGLMGANACLVHIVEPIESPEQADEDTQAFHDQLMEAARVKIQLESERMGGTQIQCRVELGHRPTTLLALANELQPLMVVLGSSLHDWPSSQRVGVGLQVLTHASYPLLFVP